MGQKKLQNLHACFTRNNPCFDFKTDMNLKNGAQTTITWNFKKCMSSHGTR